MAVMNLHIIPLAVPKPGTVIKIPETGTTITYSTTTAESVAPNGTKVTLHGLDLWAEFHKSTTEMIITKAGRYEMIMPHIASRCHRSVCGTLQMFSFVGMM